MRPEGCVERCPACPHRDLNAEESRSRIQAWIGLELSEWRESLAPISSPLIRWGYRRKALLHARFLEGAWRFGMLRYQGREEEFVPIPDCPLHDPTLNARLRSLATAVPGDWPLVYALVSGRSLTLVLKCERREEWADRLRLTPTPEGQALWVNWNPGAGKRAVDGRYLERVLGEDWLTEGGLFHGPTAFRQQIPEMEAQALGAAEEFLSEAGEKVAVDLYSGLGASLLRWRARGWDTAGVELAGESVEAAGRNAPGARILRGRVEDRLPQLKEFLRERPFVVYTNPPRSGHEEKTLAWLEEEKPARIAYLSCHPRSLAGDLRRLAGGFRVAHLKPFDFFPQTGHCETLALLERK